MGDQVLNQFRSYRELREECVAIYEARGGPDTVSEAAENCTKTLRGKYRQSNFFHTQGYTVKGVGANKEFIPLNRKNTK